MILVIWMNFYISNHTQQMKMIRMNTSNFQKKGCIGCMQSYTFRDYVYITWWKRCTWGISYSINIEDKIRYLYNIIFEVDGWIIEIFSQVICWLNDKYWIFENVRFVSQFSNVVEWNKESEEMESILTARKKRGIYYKLCWFTKICHVIKCFPDLK